VFEKISNPDFKLQSFDSLQQEGPSKHIADCYHFPEFSQLTFRPEADREIASSEQLNVKLDW
jgi:hypothetical protein